MNKTSQPSNTTRRSSAPPEDDGVDEAGKESSPAGGPPSRAVVTRTGGPLRPIPTQPPSSLPVAIPHAQPGEVIDVRPLGEALSWTVTHAMVKTDRLEVIRVVLAAGRVMPEHRVAGEITVLCLEGRAAFTAAGATRELAAGRMLYLSGGEQHSLRGIEDSSLLVTILLHPERAA